MGLEEFGIDFKVLDCMVLEIGQLVGIGVQVGLVIGGGNLFCGVVLFVVGMDWVIGDYMGMLVIVMNGLVMCDVLECLNIFVLVMLVIFMVGVIDYYDCCKVMCYFGGGEVVIFFVGIGNLFFIIDLVVCLCVIEIDVDVVFKVIKVDGVYIVDLFKDLNVEKFECLIYDEVFDCKFGVMDLIVICLCCDQNMLLWVFNMNKLGVLLNIVVGGVEGILIEEG